MIPLSLDSLYDYLNKQSLDVKKQPETNQLYLIFKSHEQDVPLFFRMVEEGGLLQLLAFMPLSLRSKTLPELARLLHLFNKTIDIPGFGIDENAKVSFFRIVLPAIDGKFSGDIVSSYIKSIQVITDAFLPAIVTIVSGKATYEELAKKFEESQKKPS